MASFGTEKPHFRFDVVVLGGGFAGVYCAQQLQRGIRHRRDLKATLVAEENHMVFQPMLPEVVGAALSPRDVVNPIRLMVRGMDIFKGFAHSVDLERRILKMRGGAYAGDIRFQFEHLVLACGAVVDLSRTPGMAEHAFILQTVGDAMRLRSAIISRIEEANLETRHDVRKALLTFVVVGGGYSGVETAGHIVDLFRSVAKFYQRIARSEFQVILIHGREHLLPNLSERLGDYAADRLRRRGVRLLLMRRLTSMTATEVTLDDGSTIDTATVISTVGTAPHPLVQQVCESYAVGHERGRIVVDATGRVPGHPGLWAAGDCAAFPHSEGGWCPGTAQFAQRQGTLVGRNIAAMLHGRELQTFTFRGLGELASIGHREAVANIMGIQFSGFVAWWMWRTIYLAKLPGLSRKLLVMLEWTFELLFPRDINLLTPRTTALTAQVHLQPGDALFYHGEPAVSFYIVKSGRVEIRDAKGVVKSVGPGNFFGERALLGDGKWRFDAVAAESTTLISVPGDILRQIALGCGSFGELLMRSAGTYRTREEIEKLTRKIAPEALSQSAAQLMTRDVARLALSDTVADALRLFQEQRHSLYPVVDGEGKPAGCLQRDAFYALFHDGGLNPDMTLDQVRLAHVPSVSETATAGDVVEHLVRDGTNKVLVCDAAGRLSGVITFIDLLHPAKRARPVAVPDRDAAAAVQA